MEARFMKNSVSARASGRMVFAGTPGRVQGMTTYDTEPVHVPPHHGSKCVLEHRASLMLVMVQP